MRVEEVLAWKVDPLKRYENVFPHKLVEACGILPMWLDPCDPRLALAQFESNYNFGRLCPLEGGRIDDLGVYHYPGDPPFYPYMSTTLHGEQVYLYPHAFVGIVDSDGNSKVVRMD